MFTPNPRCSSLAWSAFVQSVVECLPADDSSFSISPVLGLVYDLAMQVGKSTLIRCLVKHYSRQTLGEIRGPITVVAGKKRRVTFVECPPDLSGMLDAAKFADLVLLLVRNTTHECKLACLQEGLYFSALVVLTLAPKHGLHCCDLVRAPADSWDVQLTHMVAWFRSVSVRLHGGLDLQYGTSSERPNRLPDCMSCCLPHAQVA
jgi:hypothetical protein